MTDKSRIANSSVITLTDHVPLNRQDTYEALVKELHQLFRQQSGFLSVDVVRHTRLEQVEYTVLLRTEKAENVDRWKNDPRIASQLNKIYSLTGGPAHTADSIGLELWVDHVAGQDTQIPPFWKRVLLSVFAVYPMLLLLMATSKPLVNHLPQPLQILTIVVILSSLLTWPIMPFLSKLLRSWLYSNNLKY